MALLIIELDKHIGNAKAWRDTFKEQIPDLPIRIWPDAGELRDIEYLAFMHPDFDLLPAFPNLKAMFSRSAGVDSFVKHPKLPKVPLGKVEPPGGDPMMTEYVIMHVLRSIATCLPIRRPRPIENGAGHRSSDPSKGASVFWASE
jgi:glyoxylate/hydroxypyruvate reductase A